MWPSLSRALDTVPPRDVRELPKNIVLQCFSHDCEGCNAFAPRRGEYERRTFGGRNILPWDCDVAHKKRLAIDAGATKLPCYVDVQTKKVVYP